MWQSNSLFVLNTKCYVWGKSNTLLSTTPYKAKLWLHHVKINRIELSTDKNLKVYLVQSAFRQTLGDEFTFQQNNNLKHKVNSTLHLLAY